MELACLEVLSNTCFAEVNLIDQLSTKRKKLCMGTEQGHTTRQSDKEMLQFRQAVEKN